MAVDQALVDLVSAPVLRLYRWQPATLTLGYFQRLSDRDQHKESLDCPVLRRSTGGGAIVHDLELTYSLILPANLVLTKTSELYDRVHESVSRILAQVGLEARRHPHRPGPGDPGTPASVIVPTPSNNALGGDATPKSTAKSVRDEPFLCFQRRATGDLILWPTGTAAQTEHADPVIGHKILGSAQRKRDGAVLQHGSILFQQSPSAPQLLGINDFLPPDQKYSLDDFSHQWVERLVAEFGWTPVASSLTPEETRRAQEHERTRFSSSAWNAMR
jgi:lipoate-protein ligase A